VRFSLFTQTVLENRILSIKNDNDNVPIEDNCLEEERSNDVRDVYEIFCAIEYLLQNIPN
jgi:hypothetical protein